MQPTAVRAKSFERDRRTQRAKETEAGMIRKRVAEGRANHRRVISLPGLARDRSFRGTSWLLQGQKSGAADWQIS